MIIPAKLNKNRMTGDLDCHQDPTLVNRTEDIFPEGFFFLLDLIPFLLISRTFLFVIAFNDHNYMNEIGN